MLVFAYIGPSVNRALMTDQEPGGAMNFAGVQALGGANDGRIDLPQGQSLFVVGGRHSITRFFEDLMTSRILIRTAGRVCLSIKKVHHFFDKNRVVVQVHAIGDGPGAHNDVNFTGPEVDCSRIRDVLRDEWELKPGSY